MENIVNSTIALYKAYRKTRCGKRDNPTAMRYRMEAIERTVALSERLQRRDYSFGPYYPFKVYEPKERLVLAIDFEGKVVQHSPATTSSSRRSPGASSGTTTPARSAKAPTTASTVWLRLCATISSAERQQTKQPARLPACRPGR
nr:MAG: MatK/TrnK amino terminal region [Bacteriophage sp.]